MGVRGKLEAVIYAAEEPVTLAQLASLFGEEALRERAAAVPPVETEQSELPEAPVEASAEPEETVEPSSGPEAEPPAAGSGDVEVEKRIARQRERAAREAVRAVLQELVGDYDRSDRGMEIREIAGGFRVATKPEYHDAVRGFVKTLKPPMKLSLPALETLAVIAYKQPVTAPEVAEIRGVDSGGVLGSLVSRKLVTTAGRKQVVGRPILYKTTKEFLLRFGLKDLNELPSMEEFEKMAGELQSMGEESEGEAEPLSLAEPPLEQATVGVSETEEASSAEESGPSTASAGPGERPRLAPLAISVSVEEPEPGGISVNRSGVPVPDPAPSDTEGNGNSHG